MKKLKLLIGIIVFTFLNCKKIKPSEYPIVIHNSLEKITENTPFITDYTTDTKTIHIIVALCDNQYQGIVPVPQKIGNGQDPNNNLYWGTAYGIKTYFKNSPEWRLVKSNKKDSLLLERIILKHKTQNYYIVADAYNGKYIKHATKTFLKSSSGLIKDTVQLQDQTLGIAGNAELVAYIGHNGLMDFSIQEAFLNTDKKEREVIVLACYSQHYFKPHLKTAHVNPLVWTTGLMAPEAYTIHDAITGYIQGESNEEIRLRAAKAYSKYQKCSLTAAKKLLVTSSN